MRLTGTRRGPGWAPIGPGTEPPVRPRTVAALAGPLPLVLAVGTLLLVPLVLGRTRPVVVLRLLGAPGAVRLAPLIRGLLPVLLVLTLPVRIALAVRLAGGLLAVLVTAVPRLLPGKVLLGARPGAGLRALLLVVGVGGRAVGIPSSEGR